MKKTVLFAAAALLSGFAVGILFGSGTLSADGRSAIAAAAAASLSPMAGNAADLPAETPVPLDTRDNKIGRAHV